MDFRYKLAKKTFKNKKIPPKKVLGEESISADQRGNDAWTDSNLLSLDKDAKRQEAPKENRELSRRDLFSFGRLSDFSDAVEEANKKSTEEESAEASNENPIPTEAPAEGQTPVAETTGDEPAQDTPAEVPGEKKGFFKRMVGKFRGSDEAEDAPLPQTEGNEKADELPVTSAETQPIPLPTVEPEPDEDPEYSRRNLLREGVHFFAKPAIQSVQDKITRVNDAVDKITKRVPLLRPPGAISEQQFLQACTRCDDCIHACPKDAIQRVPKKMGFLIMGTPYIDPKTIPCVMCDDLPCISACSDGALLPAQSKFDVNMGYAILDKNKCQAYGETFCQQCVIDCPIPGAIDQVNGQPVINKKTCTGCGVCVLSCSTVNIPVAIKIKPQMVIESQIRKKRLEEERARIQAEREAAKLAEEETDSPETGEEQPIPETSNE